MSARARGSGRTGRQIKLRELQILSLVVELGSMAKAAAQLSLTQPTVSDAVANLETFLGVRLLDRSPRGVEPTIYAHTLLKRGRVAFDELEQAIKDIDYLKDPTTGEIRVGCPESLAAGPVPAIIDRFSRLHPRVTFRVTEANTATMEFRELKDRTVDLMLGRISERVVDEEVDVTTLFNDQLFAVASANSPWVGRRKIALSDLLDAPWILAPSNNVVRHLFIEAFKAQGLEAPHVTVVSNSMHVRMHLLATGRFITVLAGSLLHYNAERWSIKRIPVDFGTILPVAVATLKNRSLSPVVEQFIKCFREFALPQFK